MALSESKSRGLEYCFGEDIVSLRALAMRSCFYRTFRRNGAITGTFPAVADIHFRFPKLPPPAGFSDWASTDTNFAKNIAQCNPYGTGNNYYYNFAKDGFLQKIMYMFHGYKGSIRWRIRAPDNTKIEKISLSKTDFYPGDTCYISSGTFSSKLREDAKGQYDSGMSGLTIANTNHLALVADIPDTYTVKFSACNPLNRLANTYYLAISGRADQSKYNNINLGMTIPLDTAAEISDPKYYLETYVSASPGMRFCWYKCIPVMFHTTYSLIPDAS